MLVSISINKFAEIQNTTTNQAIKKAKGNNQNDVKENSIIYNYLLYEEARLALIPEVQQLPSKTSRLCHLRYRIIHN